MASWLKYFSVRRAFVAEPIERGDADGAHFRKSVYGTFIGMFFRWGTSGNYLTEPHGGL